MNQRGFGLEDSVKVRSVSSLAIGPTILRFCFGSYAWHHGMDDTTEVVRTFSTHKDVHNSSRGSSSVSRKINDTHWTS